jgi:hypothetical protein
MQPSFFSRDVKEKVRGELSGAGGGEGEQESSGAGE